MVLDPYKDKKEVCLGHYIKRLLRMIFIGVQNEVKLSVREEDSSSNKVMGWSFGKPFYALNEGLIKMEASELVNESVIIDFLVVGAGDRVRVDNEVFLRLLYSSHSLSSLMLFFCLLSVLSLRFVFHTY